MNFEEEESRKNTYCTLWMKWTRMNAHYSSLRTGLAEVWSAVELKKDCFAVVFPIKLAEMLSKGLVRVNVDL